MKLVTFISAGAFLVMSAFLMKKETATRSSLYDTRWSLKKIHDERGTEEVRTKVFIRFDREKQSAGGNGGCNSFGSTATVNNKEVHFTHIFSTKMYCEELQKTENAFLKALGKVNRFEIKGKRLLLYVDKEAVLEFLSE